MEKYYFGSGKRTSSFFLVLLNYKLLLQWFFAFKNRSQCFSFREKNWLSNELEKVKKAAIKKVRFEAGLDWLNSDHTDHNQITLIITGSLWSQPDYSDLNRITLTQIWPLWFKPDYTDLSRITLIFSRSSHPNGILIRFGIISAVRLWSS